MKRTVKMIALVLAVSSMGMASNSFASGEEDLGFFDIPAVKNLTTIVGLGVAAVPEYEGSDKYKGAPVPLIRTQNPSGQYLQLAGTTLTINVVPDNSISFGPEVRYRMERNDEVENEQVKLMKEVDAAVEVGAFVGYQYENWSARFEMVQDTTNGHSGSLASLSVGYKIPLPPSASVAFNLSSTYADDDYMQTYFGVDAENDGTSTLPDYTAEAGVKDVAFTVVGNYRIDAEWGVIGVLRFAQLLGDAADSPLVDAEGNAGQAAAGVVVTYTF